MELTTRGQPAQSIGCFEHKDALTALGQIGRANQSVVSCANDYGVIASQSRIPISNVCSRESYASQRMRVRLPRLYADADPSEPYEQHQFGPAALGASNQFGRYLSCSQSIDKVSD